MRLNDSFGIPPPRPSPEDDLTVPNLLEAMEMAFELMDLETIERWEAMWRERCARVRSQAGPPQTSKR